MPNGQTTPELLASQERAVLVAAAGCGKTHIIAESIKYTEGRQLILTHTHAGVHSIRAKLARLNVNPKQYRVETIDGFALRFASAYPQICGYQIYNIDHSIIYDNLYDAAYNVINTTAGRKIISSSYAGLFVDEYQDCTKPQHKLILLLAEILPTRILGDPLQGIFEFSGKRELVDWQNDIYPTFTCLPDLVTPWRWVKNNISLGRWLIEVRRMFEEHKQISLHKKDLPRNTYCYSKKCQIKALKEWSNGVTIGIIKIVNRAHYIAYQLEGRYNSMEEIEKKELIGFVNKFENRPRFDKIIALLDLSFKCITKAKSEIKQVINALKVDNNFRGRKHKPLYDKILQYQSTGYSPLLSDILCYIEKIDGVKIYRKELWNDLKKLMKSHSLNPDVSLISLARKQIEIQSKMGRFIYNKTISRPFLIKGLEFNHAIILDADDLTPKELYVSLTRGSNYLTILSDVNILNPKY